MYVTKGLVIAEPWIDFILRAEKSWEMRSAGTSFRGWFGLIRKGSGTVVGIAELNGRRRSFDAGGYARQHRSSPNSRGIDQFRRSDEVDHSLAPRRSALVEVAGPLSAQIRCRDLGCTERAARVRSDRRTLGGRSVLTEGNLKNSHFYMRSFLDAFPPNAVGGSNARSRTPRDVVVDWGGESPARTDIDGAKQAMQFAA